MVDEGVVVGKRPVERDPADGGVDALAGLAVPERDLAVLVEVLLDEVVGETHPDERLQVEVGPAVVRELRVVEAGERATLALAAFTLGRQVVEADDHVLRRHGERTAV